MKIRLASENVAVRVGLITERLAEATLAFRYLLAVLAFSHFAFSALSVQAAAQTITASHTYVMGDRDSKEDARALCYITAKRKLLEEVGVLIESASEVKNFELTKDQINSYSAAILSVEVVKEEFAFDKGTTSLTMTVKANVNMAEVRKRLAEIVANKGLQAKVEAQQQQIRKIEQQLQALNEKLSGASEGSKDELQEDKDAELFAFFRLEAERGKAWAQTQLGVMYAKGRGVVQDYAQAVAWHRKAAEQNYAIAQFNLGLMYDDGHGVPQDYQQAVRWYRQAAEAGNAGAQLNLGAMYAKGRGVPQDYVQARRWFTKAAEAGDASAQFNLGVIYGTGHGVPQDYQLAVRWYRQAAEAGDASAQFNLGVMYANGHGVPQDYVQAHKWFNIAATDAIHKESRDQAVRDRDRLAQIMTPQQISEAQKLAREWKPNK